MMLKTTSMNLAAEVLLGVVLLCTQEIQAGHLLPYESAEPVAWARTEVSTSQNVGINLLKELLGDQWGGDLKIAALNIARNGLAENTYLALRQVNPEILQREVLARILVFAHVTDSQLSEFETGHLFAIEKALYEMANEDAEPEARGRLLRNAQAAAVIQDENPLAAVRAHRYQAELEKIAGGKAEKPALPYVPPAVTEKYAGQSLSSLLEVNYPADIEGERYIRRKAAARQLAANDRSLAVAVDRFHQLQPFLEKLAAPALIQMLLAKQLAGDLEYEDALTSAPLEYFLKDEYAIVTHGLNIQDPQAQVSYFRALRERMLAPDEQLNELRDSDRDQYYVKLGYYALKAFETSGDCSDLEAYFQIRAEYINVGGPEEAFEAVIPENDCNKQQGEK